jgi:hypothetical protein
LYKGLAKDTAVEGDADIYLAESERQQNLALESRKMAVPADMIKEMEAYNGSSVGQVDVVSSGMAEALRDDSNEERGGDVLRGG